MHFKDSTLWKKLNEELKVQGGVDYEKLGKAIRFYSLLGVIVSFFIPLYKKYSSASMFSQDDVSYVERMVMLTSPKAISVYFLLLFVGVFVLKKRKWREWEVLKMFLFLLFISFLYLHFSH